MTSFLRKAASGLALAAMAATVCIASSAPAGASTTVPVDESVDASTTLATLHQTVTVPPGTVVGTVDLGSGALQGTLALPPATATVAVAGVGLATATFVIAPVGPVTGSVQLSTLAVTATSRFDIRIASLEPLGLPVNLVGGRCTTSRPVSVTFSGVFAFGGSSTFSGTYAIPPLHRCGVLTPALDVAVSGPGNQFSATFRPRA